MDTLSIILVIIGAAVLIFSFWGFQLIRKHVKRFKDGYKFSNSLNDEKYFELKARQDYIIASSTIVFAVLSFIGYASIKDIKAGLNEQLSTEIKKIDNLNNSATATFKNLEGLQITGDSIRDSVRSAIRLVSILKGKLVEVYKKDIISQNIFIVDPLRLEDFPKSTEKDMHRFKTIKFKDLTTVSGQKLPHFIVPPSLMCFSTNGSSMFITDITNEGFKINPQASVSLAMENSEPLLDKRQAKFSLWISQKTDLGDFSKDFDSSDFR